MAEVHQAFEQARDQEWEDQKTATYERLLSDIPRLVSGLSILEMGSQGMVLDDGKGQLLKVFLRDKEAVEGQTSQAERSFKDEVEILKDLGGLEYGTALTPELLEVILLPDSTEAYGAYRMPKLQGHNMKYWREFIDDTEPSVVEEHFRNVGEVLGRFHMEAEPLLADRQPADKRLEYGAEIQSVPFMAARVNQALRLCDQYLQKNMKDGVNHGDFNPSNFLVNEGAQIISLLDLSFAGHRKNYLTDFAMIPDDKVKFAIETYEEVTGKKIDSTMMRLTQLSFYTSIINYNLDKDFPESAEVIANITAKTLQHLNALSGITGMKFNAEGHVLKV